MRASALAGPLRVSTLGRSDHRTEALSSGRSVGAGGEALVSLHAVQALKGSTYRSGSAAGLLSEAPGRRPARRVGHETLVVNEEASGSWPVRERDPESLKGNGSRLAEAQ